MWYRADYPFAVAQSDQFHLYQSHKCEQYRFRQQHTLVTDTLEERESVVER